MKDAGQNAAREYELKFELDAADARKIETHPLLAESVAETRRLSSVYFDTPDFVLRKAGVALRVRDTGRGYVQTIKVAGPQLFDRLEWEHPVPGFDPDLAAAAATGLAPFREPQIGKRLRAGFRTTIERTGFSRRSKTAARSRSRSIAARSRRACCARRSSNWSSS